MSALFNVQNITFSVTRKILPDYARCKQWLDCWQISLPNPARGNCLLSGHRMKCVVVVNQLNDPFYIDYDVEFTTYIINRAKEKGLLEKDAEITELDANLVMQLFSPLVLSQWLLIETTKEPCSSILCPDGFLFVFKHVDDLLFLAISGDGTETEAFLHRKLQVFVTILRFMFGPVSEELGQAHSYTKKAKWDFVRQLMRNWSELVQSEQAFLVEAIERVHVNQLVNEKCVEVLEKSVKQFQAARDHPVQHAVLLVNSKLLALYSKRSAHELHAKHILTLMNLAKTIYPSSDKLEDLFSRQYPNIPNVEEENPPLSVHIDDNSDGGDDEYHSAQNSPSVQRSRSSTFPAEETTEKLKSSKFGFTLNTDELSLEDSEQTPTGGTNSSSQLSYSESGTYQNNASSDQDTLSQLSDPEREFSLLDLYNEKYPHDKLQPQTKSPESEKSLENDVSQEKNKKKKKHDLQNVISIMVDVHQESGPSGEGLDTQDSTSQDTNNSIPPPNSSKVTEDIDHAGISEDIGRSTSPSGSELVIPESQYVNIDQEHIVSETQNIVGLSAEGKQLKDQIDTHGDDSQSSNVKTLNDSKTIADEEKTPKEQPQWDGLTKRKVPASVKDSTILESDPALTQTSSLPNLDLPSENDNSTSDLHKYENQSPEPVFKGPSSGSPVIEEKSVPQQLQGRCEADAGVSGSKSGTDSSSRSSSRGLSGRSSRSSNLSPQDPLYFRDEPSRSQSRVDTTFAEDLLGSKRIRPKTELRQADSSLHSTTSTFTPESSFLSGSTIATYGGHIKSGIYTPQTVFLETPSCPYSPYNIHTLQILPGITLMLLSQAPKHTLADSLYQIIQNVKDLMYGRRAQMTRLRAVQVHEVINSLLSKLHNSLKKQKGRVRILSFEIYERWEKEDLKYKLLDFLEKDPSTAVPPELESPMMEMYKKLKELFSHLYLTHLPQPPQLSEALSQLRLRISKELEDYREYLNVKSRRNITMTSYINDFPGLIHFIFINRRFHQMTAPSLNIETKESMDATAYLKEKIWTMYQHMMNKLREGYTTIMMRDGDFYFSYFLWFEDYTGNTVPVQESYKPARRMPYPGTLCGSFYKDLLDICFPHAIKDSVHCFEVFLMHLGTAHPQYIASHCKKLAHKMWEMSGEAYNSVSLL